MGIITRIVAVHYFLLIPKICLILLLYLLPQAIKNIPLQIYYNLDNVKTENDIRAMGGG